MKRNYINSCLVKPWIEEFENLLNFEAFNDKEF